MLRCVHCGVLRLFVGGLMGIGCSFWWSVSRIMIGCVIWIPSEFLCFLPFSGMERGADERTSLWEKICFNLIGNAFKCGSLIVPFVVVNDDV